MKTRKALSALLTLALLLGLVTPITPVARAAAEDSGVTFNVLDYGADPTGAKESSHAVQDALAAAAEEDPATHKTIYFPKGEYHFYAGYSAVRRLYASNTLSWNEAHNLGYQDKYIGILVENMENVTIDGGGSKFIFHGNICTMAAINSRNVTFTNFEEDHASPSVVEMLVESVDPSDRSAIIYISPCYDYEISGPTITWVAEPNSPEETEPYWKLGGANTEGISNVTLDAIAGAPSGGNAPWNNVTTIQEIDATHLKITYSSTSNLPAVGKRYQRRNTAPRMTPGVFVSECDNVTFRNAVYRFLHGFGMLLQVTKDVTFDNVTVGGNTDTGRDCGGFADFIHGSTVAGTVTIQNCNFDGAQDDAINIHGTYLQVTKISEDRKTLEVRYMHAEAWGFPQYHIGDTVDFTSQTDMTPVENSTRRVVALCNPGEGKNMDGTARSKDKENDMRTIIVTLDEGIPEEITTDSSNNYGYVMENVTYTPDVVIDNNRFSNINACGILVTTRKPIQITNNYFDRTSNASIYIAGATHGYNESGRVEDLLIQGNTFISSPSTSHFKAQGAIRIQPEDGRGTNANPPTTIYKNVRILDNNFLMMNSTYAVNIDNVDGLTVENNRFLRYDAAINLNLSASGNGTLPVGGAIATTLEKSAKQIDKRLFRLETCENVTFSNNTYDDGLNLGVDFSRGTTADHVTLTGDALTLGGDNKLPAVGAVSYISSDPAVAAVNTNGEVTGLRAGTAEIYAYTVTGGRTFMSNPIAVTVEENSGGAATGISITGSDTAVLNTETAYTATTVPEGVDVTWAVKPVSEGVSAAITQDGMLTVNTPGLVEVTATAGNVSASQFVTASGAILSNAWKVAGGETENGWKLDPATDRVSIDAIASNSDWSSKTAGRNKIVTAVGSGDFEATVKLIGAPCAVEECMEEAGLTIYKDGSNYVSIARKNQGVREGTPWLSIIGEKNGSSTEIHMTYQETVEELYLKVKKTGNVYTGYYSEDGTNWTQIKDTSGKNSYTTDMTGYQAGVYAHGGLNDKGEVKHDPRFYGFADFTLKTGENAASPIVFTSTNQPPSASDAQLAVGDAEIALDYTFTDPDGDADTASLIVWYAADTETGPYSRVENAAGKTLTVTAGISRKWVKAVVAPADSEGHFGAPIVSEAVQAPTQENDPTNATLSMLSVDSGTLFPAFDAETTAYTVSLPSEVDAVTVSAQAAQAAATVTGNGMVTLDKDLTDHVIRVENSGTVKEYTITFRRFKGGDSSLVSLTAGAGGNQIAFEKGTRYYALDGERADTMTFTAQAAADAVIKVRYNDEELGDYTNGMTLPLEFKLNTLELRVLSPARTSLSIYRVVITKDISSDTALGSLKVDGKEITIGGSFDLGRTAVGETAILEASANDEAASVFLNVNGKAVENGTTFPVDSIHSDVIIRVVAEDGISEKIYTLKLIKQNDNDAALYSLDLGGFTLAHDGRTGFDPAVTEYTAVNYGNNVVTLSAEATQAGAQVTYETVAEYKIGQNGAVTGPCSFFKDVGIPEGGGDAVNTVTVTVTSPNGQNTEIYTIHVSCKEEVYLSDLDWMAGSYSAWRNIKKDYEVDDQSGNKKMRLLDSNNQVVTFDKGLGTHADSEIFYDLSPIGFTTFTAKVGLDYSQFSNKVQKLQFDVFADEKNLGSTLGTELRSNTPYAEINATIPAGAKKLTLKAIHTDTSQSNPKAAAHADWADAKLSSDLHRLADTQVPVQYLDLAVTELVLDYNKQENFDLAAGLTLKPSGATSSALTWSSNDSTVVAVSNGLVTAAAPGTAIVTVSTADGSKSATCAVTVNCKPTGIVVKKDDTEVTADTSLRVYTNEDHEGHDHNHSLVLTAEVRPENATNKAVNWTRETVEGKVTLSRDGNKLTVTAVHDQAETNVGPVTLEIAAEADPTVKKSVTVDVFRRLENNVSISIQGVNDPSTAPRLGDTLEADINQLKMTDAGKAALKYQWYILDDEDNALLIDGADSKTYTLTADTIGYLISVEVTADEDTFYEGTRSFTRPQAVEKADGPDKGPAGLKGFPPSSDGGSDGSITGFGADFADFEYSLSGTDDWTDVTGTTVTGLEAGHYQVRARETDTHKAGAPVTVIIPEWGATYYQVTLDAMTGGAVTRSDDQAVEDTEVTLTVRPAAGYELDELTVTGDDGSEIELNGEGDTFTFLMPGQDVSVSATFRKRRLTIDHSGLVGLRCSEDVSGVLHQHEVEYGDVAVITLVPQEGFALPPRDSIVITNTDTDQRITGWTINDQGAITITGGVTGNLSISASAIVKSYVVNYALTNGLSAPEEHAARRVDHKAAYTGTLVVAQGYALPENVTVTMGGAAFTDFTYEDGVLTIAQGKITGNLVITAAGLPDVPVAGVSLDRTSLSLSAGASATLTATLYPAGATNHKVTWHSSDETIATVDAQGKVTALSAGSAVISVTTEDGNKTATCAVTVTGATDPDHPSGGDSSDNGSSGGGKPAAPAEETVTVTNPDGSSTTTVTNKKTGTVTETTQWPDGAVRVVETKKNGTVSDALTQPDGKTVKRVTTADKDLTVTVTDARGLTVARVELPAILPRPELIFVDVPENHWAEKAIYTSAGLGLVKGVGENRYDMTASMTRGSLATVLYRLSNGRATGRTGFADVEQNEWYAEAIAWASAHGVVTGVSADTFKPRDVITREQLAVMLSRYAALLGLDASGSANSLNKFSDGGRTGDWAVEGVAWCVEKGILQGKGGNVLDPTAEVSRAEVAVMLERFLTLLR